MIKFNVTPMANLLMLKKIADICHPAVEMPPHSSNVEIDLNNSF
jgi:hypothetical protein